MKKVLFLVIALSLSLSACLPAILQPQATPTASPAPISVEDLQATATILAQESLQSLSTPILAPSETSVAVTAANTSTQEVPTETQNPILLTSTATLGAGIALPENGTATSTAAILASNGTPTIGTPHPLHSGTMPPNLPFGKITLFNRSKVEVYISLRCVTKDGYVTIIEYPVGGMIKANAPAGKYTYVVWVGGRQILGSFALGNDQNLTIKIFKDRVEIK